MSADEFDPMVERLFAKPPAMADAASFEAAVLAHLDKGSRLRSAVFWVAGLAGGAVAVRQVVGGELGAMSSGNSALAQLSADSTGAGNALQGVLDRAGLQAMDLGVMGGAQVFWVVAAGLVAALAVGAIRLSQEV